MAYTYNEDGTSSSTFNKNRGHQDKPLSRTAAGMLQGSGSLISTLGIAYLGLKAINSANED